MPSKLKSLMSEIKTVLSKTRALSPGYRQSLSSTMKTIVDDLLSIDRLVYRLNHLSNDILFCLVDYWRKKGNTNRTIQRKISSLRKVVSLKYSDYLMLTNNELGIQQLTQPKVDKISNIITIGSLDMPEVQLICEKQLYLGLKKTEAIRFQQHYLAGKTIHIPRKIAYNNRDRIISIKTNEQKRLVDKLADTRYATSYDEKLLSRLHQFELKKRGVTNPDYFRWLYVDWRFKALFEEKQDRKGIITQLSQELGYVENRQVKEILRCLTSS